ncbi:hypothetical protein DFH09DRAFT_1039099 [Mycena vulgaris]|nr:hypothetical protein DFH09DRAFT_1039099 [Mycena vulgaris]
MDAPDGAPETTSKEHPKRVDDLWFPEGSLVLQADDRIFRIPASILAARSPVFTDMLTIPQPEIQPLIDGCPVVVLHDSAVDAEYFLKAIFDSSFFERPPAHTPFRIVAAVLRLSTKYDVQYLRHRALLHLSFLSPTSLKEYDDLCSSNTVDLRSTEILRASLVDSLGLTWAIPGALHPLSRLPIAQILETVPSGLQRRCLIGREALMVSQNRESLRFLRSLRVEGCDSDDRCRSARQSFLESFIRSDVVRPLRLLSPEGWAYIRSNTCSACFLAAQTEHNMARQAVWVQLPSIFNLPSWAELESAKTADLQGK